MTILNEDALDQWMNERRRMGRDLVAVKGEPPAGMLDMDGDPEVGPINVAWKDAVTGEVFAIEYDVPSGN